MVSVAGLFTVEMEKRTPLSDAERKEKQAFRALFDRHKKAWEATTGRRLTQQRLGEIAGQALKGEPFTQGMIWQYLSAESDTRLAVPFVQFVASMLGFDPSEVGKRFAIPDYIAARVSIPSPLGTAAASVSVDTHEEQLFSILENLEHDRLMNVLSGAASILGVTDQILLAERILSAARAEIQQV